MTRTTLPHSLGAALTAEQIRVTVPQMLALLADERGPRYVCQRGSKPGYSVTAYCPRAHVIYRAHSATGLVSALKGIVHGRMGDLRILDKSERLADTLDFVQPMPTSMLY